MIKLFAFAASCAGEKSRTARYADALAAAFTKKAEKTGEQVVYRRMTGADLRIEFCRSCNSCFMKGLCPLDSVDDMSKLKKELTESDVILFGSPVYLADMSGLAKCVLDRLSYWAHRFELAGKVGAAFATTSSSFGRETAEHIKTLLSYTGLTLVRCGHAVTSAGHPNLYLEPELAPELDAIAGELLSAWRDPAPFVTPLQEGMLKTRNAIDRRNRCFADLIDREPWNETQVCEARKISGFASFAEMASQRKGRIWDDFSRSAGDGKASDENA